MIGFSRVGPSKNRSGERLRTAPAKKNDKNRFRRRLRTHFFASGRVFCRFWVPGRTSKMTKKRPLQKVLVDFLAPEIVFLYFLRSGAFRKGPGPIPEAPEALPDQRFSRILRYFSAGFCDSFLRVACRFCRGLSGSVGMLPGIACFFSSLGLFFSDFRVLVSADLGMYAQRRELVFAILFCRLRADFVRVCRVPPGCCRDPHPDAVIHSPFSPGVRRFAQRFKFAVPQRGAGRVETKTTGRAWKVYPSFPSRRPPTDRRTLPRPAGFRLFFGFFRFFSR